MKSVHGFLTILCLFGSGDFDLCMFSSHSAHAVFLFVHILDFASCQHITHFNVPETAILGGKATLECGYDLESEGEQFLSLTWYKENEPFYRLDRDGPLAWDYVPGVQVNVNAYFCQIPKIRQNNSVRFCFSDGRISCRWPNCCYR